MKRYLETVFDLFVIVATVIAAVVSFVGLIMLIGGSDNIQIWMEVVAIVVLILGGSYLFCQFVED